MNRLKQQHEKDMHERHSNLIHEIESLKIEIEIQRKQLTEFRNMHWPQNDDGEVKSLRKEVAQLKIELERNIKV